MKRPISDLTTHDLGVATVRTQTGGVIATLGWSLPPTIVLDRGESVTIILRELNSDLRRGNHLDKRLLN